MKVVASTRPNRPYLKNADIIRVNGAYIFADELINICEMYRDKPLFVDIPTKREKVNISNINVADVISILKTKHELNPEIKDIIAFSKVETPVELLLGSHFLACAKIESISGVFGMHAIAKEADIICIDRIDLMNEIKDIKTYFAYEDSIINIAQQHNKQVFIASDILPSMIKEKNVTFPEMTQLKYYRDKNIDAVILAEETAVGFYPYHTIDIVKKIVKKKLKIHFSTKRPDRLC
jgi:pyruvate kinase